MDNFVSVILKTKDLDENAIIEAMLGALDAPLAERVNQYGLFESDNDNIVLRLETPYELDDDESDGFAESFAKRMFEMGYDDFEIETSLDEALDAKLNAAIKAINSQGSMWKKAKQGSVNSKEIKTIQQALNQLGFKAGKADGWFGKNTAKAVMAFQKSKGLKVDGDPGPNTLKAMLNAVKDTSAADNQTQADKAMGGPAVFKDKEKGLSDVPPKVQTDIAGFGDMPKMTGPELDLPKSIADFKGVKTPKDVIKIGNDAIEKAREGGDLAQIAQIAAASLANMPNQLTPQQKAAISKEIIQLVDPEELNNPQVRSAIAPAELAVDVADAGTDEKALQAALEKFVISTYPEAIPARLRDKIPPEDVAKRSMEVIVKKAQEEGLMSQFTDPSKAVKIIKDTVDKIAKDKADTDTDNDSMSAANQEKDRKTSNKDDNKDVKVAVKPLAKDLRGAMKGIGTTEDEIKDALSKINSEEEWLDLQKTYEDEFDRDLLDDLRRELNRRDFKKYVTDVLPDEIKVKYSVRESITHGMFEETYDGDDFYEVYGWIGSPDEDLDLWEAEYRGRKVKLNKPMQGDVKKFKVYVKNPKGNIVKVNFGDPNMRIKKSNPKRRKSFRARHNCDNPGPKTKARYWSCRKW
tara:strand:+ start:8724 stop:10628 length:1905 start_codon:yes stop_codon:yes gene_type:complete